jgi:hypothetical protein
MLMLMGSKGIATTVGQILSAMFVIGLISLAVIILYENYTEVHIMIEEQTIRRQTISLANVILTSSDVVEREHGILQRALFDEDLLDEKFLSFEQISGLGLDDFVGKVVDTTGKNEFFEYYSHPNTLYYVVVRDLETGREWFVFGHGPIFVGELDFLVNLKCLWRNLFEGGFPTIYDLQECLAEDESRENFVMLDFPINIKDGNEFHMGKMEMLSMELRSVQ